MLLRLGKRQWRFENDLMEFLIDLRVNLSVLSDEMATKVDVQIYSDTRDVMLKALVESINKLGWIEL